MHSELFDTGPNFFLNSRYIARRLMTDPSPRLRKALRYMVYGREGSFDAENLIDLLQALEKFTAIRDDGDGSAFKVDGVRGNKVVGKAGDFSGSQEVNTEDRNEDARFRVTGTTGTIPVAETGTSDDERTVREALRFFFSPEGQVFREFMLEEIVNVVDASGRDALQELLRSTGLSRLPMPSFVKAMNPEMTQQEKAVSEPLQVVMG